MDEVPHIGAGYSYLVKQDMRLNPEHPPLAKDIAALPLLFLNLKQSVFDTKFWQTDINGQWEFGRNLIFNSGNSADQIKHYAKTAVMIFFILSAILVFVWTKRLYGSWGAILALILFSFSPTILAHSRFVTTDIPALFGILLATYFFIKFLKSLTIKSVIFAGLALGIALLTKFSTVLLIPYFVLLAFIYWAVYKPQLLALASRLFAVFTIALIFVIWPVYFFHTYNYPPERQRNDTRSLLITLKNRTVANVLIWSADKPLIRPLAQYGLGLSMVGQRAVGGNTTYFMGEVSRFGWHKYFPIVYFIKEPLAWWGLVLIAIFSIAIKFSISNFQFSKIKDFIRNHFTELAMLIWLGIYWATTLYSNLNIGVRHLLPVYGFTIILVSGQISKLVQKRIWKFVICALLVWYVGENLSVYPYYLTYFNQTVGGPSGGYRYVVDSNLDWGQDLVRLSDWVKQNNISKIELDYFGWADPAYYLKERYVRLWSTEYRDAADFMAHNQSNGWLAVSATFLQGSQGSYDQPNPINYNNWLKQYQPVTIIGNSIFVYQIR